MSNMLALIVLSIISIALIICVPRHYHRQRKARQGIRLHYSVLRAGCGCENPVRVLEEIFEIAQKYSIDLSKDYKDEHPSWNKMVKEGVESLERYSMFYGSLTELEKVSKAIPPQKIADLEAKLETLQNRSEMLAKAWEQVQHNAPVEQIEVLKLYKLDHAKA